MQHESSFELSYSYLSALHRTPRLLYHPKITMCSTGLIPQQVTEQLSVPYPGTCGTSIQVTYVWIDANGDIRHKIRILCGKAITLHSDASIVPDWNFDGSSTGQAETHNSEILLHPVRMYNCFFFNKCIDFNKCIALCECLNPDGTPTSCNKRAVVKSHFVWGSSAESSCWFGFEQEYYILPHKLDFGLLCEQKPPFPQGPYYCSHSNFGYRVAQQHMDECIKYGLNITGINAEVGPRQYEYQLLGKELSAADDLIISRFLLQKIASEHQLLITFHPKPFPGKEWNGSGLHTNFSTPATRADGGYEEILNIVKRLEKNHTRDIATYGADNEERMSGECETAKYDTFTWGIADRTASVRIGTDTVRDQKGYLEDRRPASNANPYCILHALCLAI
jgi:glutamine synthetase